MTELLTAAQMRALEAAAVASGEVTGLELMERAGRGVVAAVFAEWPELGGEAGALPQTPGYLQTENVQARRAVVLCGPGGNGGDGFVVARLLKELGWAVEVFLYGEPERMPPDARVNYERWLGMGEVRGLSHFVPETYSPLRDGQAKRNWIIDAIFGTGLTRPLEGAAATCANSLRSLHLGRRPAIIAIDVPSGICADSGRHIGVAMPAEQIVTFHVPKVGNHLDLGARTSFVLTPVSLGLSTKPAPPGQRVALIPTLPEVLSAVLGKDPSPPTGEAAHKFSHGHALILSGPTGHGGAARLAARGALRIGAGLVTLGCPPQAIPENAARVDAVMLREVADGAGLAEVLGDARINALCLGPGLGLDDRAAGLVRVALGGSRGEPRPTVLDADALTILSRDAASFAALHKGCVLTPHAGEFARLFPDIAAKLEAPATRGPAYSKVDATREAAARAGCVVLFKGADTVIAAPDGRSSINSAHYDRAAPWLATAGSGDVLAGFITGLMARGFAPMDAAETAAWLHVECALSFGPGLIAEDLPEELPKVFRKLGV